MTVSNTGPPPPPADEVVIHAADVPTASLVGNWVRLADGTAADGVALWNSDKGAGKITPALVTPQNYFEVTFNAVAGTPYHLWLRLRAQNNSLSNDSIHVQFSDSVDAANAPIYRIGSSGTDNSAQVVLQEADGGTISNWGWADQGWNGLGGPIYFAASGSHTLRIQQREDGVILDQIVISPNAYLTTAPGAQKNDSTILPTGTPPPPPPPDTTAPTVSLSSPASGSTVSGAVSVAANSSDNVGVSGVQFMLDGSNIGSEDTVAPYSMSWDTTAVSNGTHSLAARARDAAGNATTSATVSVTVSNSGTPPSAQTVVLRAGDVPASSIFGNWVRSSDATAADGIALWNTDNGAAKIDPALVTPQNYVEITFNAQAGTPYHLWIRMRAQNDYYGNDSIHVQFSGFRGCEQRCHLSDRVLRDQQLRGGRPAGNRRRNGLGMGLG